MGLFVVAQYTCRDHQYRSECDHDARRTSSIDSVIDTTEFPHNRFDKLIELLCFRDIYHPDKHLGVIGDIRYELLGPL